MAILMLDDIIEATGGELLSENSKTFTGVSIDSRTIGEDELFFAIRGEKFDGHDYLTDALRKGGGAVVDTRPGSLLKGKVIVFVDNTLRSLQDLAHFLREKRDIPLVAVTGSNGKTTTKEMIYLILSRKYKVLKNEGNFNNHIGLPLSLMRLSADHEVIVLEMGMNAPGEIRRLCEIAVPSHGVITNIGSAHVGKVGGYKAVRDAKLEIINGLREAVVNADDDFLMEGFEGIKDFDGKVITFAVNNDADVTAHDVQVSETGSNFTLNIKDGGKSPVSLHVHGLFNVYNALAAAAVSFSLGMGLPEIKDSLEAYRAFPMRFEVIEKAGITVINDAYNANPSSIRESVMELLRLKAGRRGVAVLGDMRELREFSEDEHRRVGRMICESGVDVFIAVGEKMICAAEESAKIKGESATPEIISFVDINEARTNIMNILEKGDIVLIKGSRSMSMEKIVEGIPDAV